MGADDTRYGPMTVQLGFLSAAQLKECLSVQKKMSEMGVDEPLGDIMQKKGVITPEQHRAILKALGVQTSPIPGFAIQGKLGQGGMGTVYKAEQTSVHRVVALKVMSSLATSDPSFIVRFQKEAEAAAKLNHPNIISAIDAGQANGVCYFAMEYVAGKTTRELVHAAGPFDEKKTLDVAVQIARALDYIHKHRLIHRDIKPENILLTREGVAKLGDFGLAKSTSSREQSLTQTGYAVGTPYTMSPEQVRGDKDVDIRADLYSLGATMWYWTTGRFVFQGSSAAETMSMHLNSPAPDPRKHGARISEGLAGVIHTLLDKDRMRRYASPSLLVDDLERLRKGEAVQHARMTPITHHKTRRVVQARKTNLALPIGLGAGVLLAVIAVIAWPRGTKPEPEEPKPQPAAKKPDPPAPKGDDPAKLATASRIYGEAAEHFSKERWSRALEAFHQLQKDHADLEYVAAKTAEIGEKISKCEVRIREAEEARRKKRSEADALFRGGDWEKARAAYAELQAESDVKKCDAELAAVASMKTLVDHVWKCRWKAALGEADVLGTKHASTETYRAERKAIDGFVAQAKLELQACDLYGNIQAAQAKSDWKGLSDLLAEFVTKYNATETYRGLEEDVKKIREILTKNAKEAEELRARTAWDDTLRTYRARYNEKKYEEAREALVSYEKTWAHTEEVGKHRKELATMFEQVDKMRAQARVGEAQKLYESAKSALAKSQYEEALRILQDLMDRYADTPTVRANDAAIRKSRAKCEDELGLGDHVLHRWDFEKDEPKFDVDGDTEPPPNWEFGNEGHTGKRGVVLSFDQAERGDWSALTLAVDGLDPTAETISFWARAEKGTMAVRAYAREEFEDGWEEWELDLTIGPDWKRYSVKLSDLQWDAAENGNRTLNRAWVRAIGFSSGRRDADVEIIVDTLCVEAARK